MIEVVNAGLQTLIVSTRRHGMENCGVASGGPADMVSCILANRLVGNKDDAGVLEMTLLPPELLFHGPCMIACTGGDCTLRLTRNGEVTARPMNRTFAVQTGDRLSGACLRTGLRAYLAVSGGFLSKTLRPTVLHRGECLPCGRGERIETMRHITTLPRPIPDRFFLLRVIEGGHIEHFSQAGIRTFLTNVYTYRQESNRMGIRFEGNAISFAPEKDGNIISEGMMPGDIQVASDGKPILMMEDCQTVGGYAKIAHLTSADLPVAAQLRPGDHVRFRFVSVEEAQKAFRKMIRELNTAIEDLRY